VPQQRAGAGSDWQTHIDREDARYADGESRLGDPESDSDAHQRQLTRLGNASAGAGLALLMAGRRDEAKEALARLQATAEQESASRCYIAAIQAVLGEKKEALGTLEVAYRERSDNCGLKVSPLFDSLRAEPRYEALLRQANLASEPQLINR
jgi:hypothetical protein